MKFCFKTLTVAAAVACAMSAQAATQDLGTITYDGDASFGGGSGTTSFQFTWLAHDGGGDLLASFKSLYPITGVVFDGVALPVAPTATSPQVMNLFDGVLTPGLHTFSVTARGSWIGTIVAESLVSTVPEPSSYALLLAGLVVAGVVLRNKRTTD